MHVFAMGLFDDFIPANREVDLLTSFAMSLSHLSETNLIELHAIVDRSSAIPPALRKCSRSAKPHHAGASQRFDGRREGVSHSIRRR